MKPFDLRTALKKRGLCPVCAAKRLVRAANYHPAGVPSATAQAAPTPPMGWASWNRFGRNVTQADVLGVANAMKAAGLDRLGYTYVNVDDCWMAAERDENGRLQADPVGFPDGIPALVKAVNELGFKLGIYSSNGTHTCEDLPASLGHEETDAQTFADWGVEYLKYDFCHNVPIPTAAPEIRKLVLSRPGCPDTVLDPAGGQLRGGAEILTDERLPDGGAYLTGLDSGGGSVVFYNVTVPEDGEYLLTVYTRNYRNRRKYIELECGGKTVAAIEAPPTRGASHDGRLQTRVTLKAGKANFRLMNPVASLFDSAAAQYRKMGAALCAAAERTAERTGAPVKPICFSICEWGLHFPWRWGASAGNLWRVSPDIRPTWASILSCYEIAVRLQKYAGPGHWNDPDMLEVGNGDLTDNENRAHFSLWCMLAAPLILGNDLRDCLLPDGRPDPLNKTLRVITNARAIAIDQDPLGIQCRRVKTNGKTDVLVKPLKDRELAVCLFNKTGSPAEISFSLASLTDLNWVTLPKAERYTVYDVWENTTFVSNGEIGEKVPGRSVKLYHIKAMA